MADEKKVARKTVAEFIATGRRKSSVARVRMTAGKGIITVNKKDIKDYLQTIASNLDETVLASVG